MVSGQSGRIEGAIKAMTMKNIPPFSNGSEAMSWYDSNCERCTRAYFPKDGNYPTDQTMKQYCATGKECKMKYDIDFSFITGEIPLETAKNIGMEGETFPSRCKMFSDDLNDKYKPVKRDYQPKEQTKLL